LIRGLPQALGPASDDISEVKATSESDLEFLLRRRSSLLLEGLDLPVSSPTNDTVGTGPFALVQTAIRSTEISTSVAETQANDHYWGGRPSIERVVFRKYATLRSAWADLLRNEVDALYEVGADAIASLEHSTKVNVFSVHRPYAFVIVLNQRHRFLRDASLRRGLNRAVHRQALLDDVFGGRGAPADGPVDPRHWAHDQRAPRFQYQPAPLGAYTLSFRCIVPDPSYERLALAVQRQLAAVGVDMQLDLLPVDEAFGRVNKGDFEGFLADIVIGPPLVRPYLFWHTGGPYNWGSYSSPAVDAALDQIRHAPDDATYKAGVAAFQSAIVNDPPAIFLVSSQRTMAVSTRFVVPADPGRDILSTVWRWRLQTDTKTERRIGWRFPSATSEAAR
jgi:peptide/nickel transport system substrate-binding protein